MSDLICNICQKETKNKTGLGIHVKCSHIKTGEIESFEEYYIKFCKINILNNCATCGIKTKFISIDEGYAKYCGHKCSMENVEGRKLKQQKTKEALLLKYGVENAGQILGHREKLKKTCLEEYGNENYVNTDKAKQTHIEKYGQHYTGTKEYREKYNQTVLEKFGVEHHTQSELVKNKSKKTCIEVYGVEHPTQNLEIKNKILKTNDALYGGTLNGSEVISKKIKITNFKNRIEVLKKANFQNCTKYIDSNIETFLHKFLCEKCNKEFFISSFCLSPSAGIRIPRCQSCFPYINQQNSLFQQEFELFLIENKVFYNSKNHSILKNNKEIDIMIPNNNIGIELNGNYWHSEIAGNKDRNYHLNKTLECQEKQIQLIHIFEDEWENRKEIIKQRVLTILNKTENFKRIHGRKCFIQKIDYQTKKQFLDENHLQGNDNSSIYLGAFFENRLVAVMTFGHPRASKNIKEMNVNFLNGNYELTRCACKLRHIIPGISSKLFSYFIKTYNPKQVISFADRRLSIGNLYEKLGFHFEKYTAPSYTYINYNIILRHHKSNFKKSLLKQKLLTYDENLSEWENMQINKFDRIWDCGLIKYIWKS